MVNNPGYRDSANLLVLRDNYAFASKALEEIASRDFVSFAGHCRDREKELMGLVGRDNPDADTSERLRLFEDALVDIETDARTIEDALTGIGFSRHEVGYPMQVIYSRPRYGMIEVLTDHSLAPEKPWVFQEGCPQLYLIPEQDVKEWYDGLEDYFEEFGCRDGRTALITAGGIVGGFLITMAGLFLDGTENFVYFGSVGLTIACLTIANGFYNIALHGNSALSKVNVTPRINGGNRYGLLTRIAQPSKGLQKEFDAIPVDPSVKARVDVDVEEPYEAPDLLQEEKKLKTRIATAK